MTDGTEHPGGAAAAPGQDTTHPRPAPPATQVPEQPLPQEPGAFGAPGPGPAVPGQPAAPGGYGYPPVPGAPGGYGYPQPPAPGGYGYPPGPNPYQTQQPAPDPSPFPQSAFQQPPAAQQQYQQPGFQQQGFQQPGQFAQPQEGPDWDALAARNDVDSRRRRRLWTGGIILLACVLGVGVGTVVIKGKDKGGSPVASASPSAPASGAASGNASGKPGNEPTVAGQPGVLADHSGQANVALGPDALVSKVQDGYVLRLRSNPNSFAQSANQIIDVSQSFSVSAWVYNEAPGGSRTVISEGDGASYSFELGRDEVNGKLVWAFRVQTAEGGADGTTVQTIAESPNTVNTWALITATYDAEQRTIALYVDGVPASSAKVPGIWSGPGPLQFGRSRHHGIWGNYWAGVVGHILIWNQPLSPAQVVSLKNGGTGLTAKPVASWLVG